MNVRAQKPAPGAAQFIGSTDPGQGAQIQPHAEPMGALLPPRSGLPGSCSLSAPRAPTPPARRYSRACSSAFGALDEGIGNIRGGKGKSEGSN